MKVSSTPECIWPECQVDGGRPALARVEELLLCTLLEVPDGLFCDAILEMGIYSTEGETLPLFNAAVFEGVVCKLLQWLWRIRTPCCLAKCSKACFASIVSSEMSLVIRWTYISLEKWSTKMVAAV